jgi:hypothetical protein
MRCRISGCESFVGSQPGRPLDKLIKLVECGSHDRERMAEIVQAVRPDVVASSR